MAFLDNSGDIILDAVLTDAGRERMARGDGSFKIVKFALGDDEINYELYQKSLPSGQKDLQIMQTPVLESFTNNTSSMKSKLISIPRTDLLYLPIILLNQKMGVAKDSSSETILVSVDETTTKDLSISEYLNGYEPTSGKNVRVDQGINNNRPSTVAMDSDLVETQYMIELDNRMASVATADGTPTPVSFVDDDNIASYYVSLDDEYVYNNPVTGIDANQAINGPRGTYVQFKLRSSENLKSSTYLFTLLGSEFNIDGVAHLYIDTTLRVTGVTTGYRIDIPIRFIKKK